MGSLADRILSDRHVNRFIIIFVHIRPRYCVQISAEEHIGRDIIITEEDVPYARCNWRLLVLVNTTFLTVLWRVINHPKLAVGTVQASSIFCMR